MAVTIGTTKADLIRGILGATPMTPRQIAEQDANLTPAIVSALLSGMHGYVRAGKQGRELLWRFDADELARHQQRMGEKSSVQISKTDRLRMILTGKSMTIKQAAEADDELDSAFVSTTARNKPGFEFTGKCPDTGLKMYTYKPDQGAAPIAGVVTINKPSRDFSHKSSPTKSSPAGKAGMSAHTEKVQCLSALIKSNNVAECHRDVLHHILKDYWVNQV